MAWGVDHHEQTLFDHAHQLVALLTIAEPGVGMHDSVGIKKRQCRIGEIKPALCKSRLAFCFVPFEIHGTSVVHWPTPIKAGGARCARLPNRGASRSASDLHLAIGILYHWLSSVPNGVMSGGAGKGNRNPAIHAGEKSDAPIVPKKPPNKGHDLSVSLGNRGNLLDKFGMPFCQLEKFTHGGARFGFPALVA